MLDHSAKAKFILALHKHSLQAFDAGGSVVQGPTAAQGSSATSSFANPTTGLSFSGTQGDLNPVNAVTNGGQVIQGIASAVTPQDQFTASGQDYTGIGGQATTNAFAEQGQQQQLASQLQAQANGQGPNPAQSQFQQNANQIGQQQAGAIASQKSLSPALAIRQASQQGAQAQQAAAGQAATLGAQQQLGAEQALAGQQSNIAQENQALYGTSVGGQTAQNTTNAQTAAQNAAALQGTTSGITGGIGALAALLAKGGEVRRMAEGGDVGDDIAGWQAAGRYQAPTASSSSSKSPIPGGSGGSSGGSGGSSGMGGAMSGIASMFAPGGQVPPADTSQITYPMPMMAKGGSPNGPKSFAGRWLNEPGKRRGAPQSQPMMSQAQAPLSAAMAKGGKVDPKLAARGGKVHVTGPGQHAKVNRDSYANDKIPALLSEGEIVIDKNTLNKPDPVRAAAEFVARTLAKRKMGRASA